MGTNVIIFVISIQAWRMVTDMGTNVIETVLPGGPSG